MAIYEGPLSQDPCTNGPLHPLEPSQGLFHQESLSVIHISGLIDVIIQRQRKIPKSILSPIFSFPSSELGKGNW